VVLFLPTVVIVSQVRVPSMRMKSMPDCAENAQEPLHRIYMIYAFVIY